MVLDGSKRDAREAEQDAFIDATQSAGWVRRRAHRPDCRIEAVVAATAGSHRRAVIPTESDPVRPQEDAGFLPRPDAADRARC